ncbi:hypothetical protein PG988_015180 [Apiospora saccharicola]
MVFKKILTLCCFKEPKWDNMLDMGVEDTAALTTVYCVEKPTVDIVAIHGLNGHAIKSFTAEKTQNFWLGDSHMLPRDIRSSRIMTFSYPASVADVFGRTSSDTFLQHATTLAHELAADRSKGKEDGARPRSLCYVSTHAMLFFGTPHNGSRRANLASYAQRMVSSLLPSKIVDTDSRLINALKDGSEILQEITDNFQPKMKRFNIFFFWEQVKTDLGAKYDYVVTETSAAPILDDTERAGIRAEHRHMCKFAYRNSPGYPLVAATLIRYSEEAPKAIARRWSEAAEFIKIMRKGEVDDLVL